MLLNGTPTVSIGGGGGRGCGFGLLGLKRSVTVITGGLSLRWAFGVECCCCTRRESEKTFFSLSAAGKSFLGDDPLVCDVILHCMMSYDMI